MVLKSLILIVISAQLLTFGLWWSEQEFSQKVVVLDRRAGELVAEVTVRLESADISWEAESDGIGVAHFQGIRPGVYRLTVDGAGWIDPAGGAQGRVVRFRDATPAIVGLERSAAISGRVTDDKGEALAGIRVFAWRAQGEATGYTDDEGRYRIHGLAAGEYAIGAVPEGEAAAGRHKGVAYYPGGGGVRRAEPVELKAGEDRDGVDLQLGGRGTGALQGRLVGLDAGTRAELALVAKGPGAAVVAGARADGEGRFQIDGIPAGEYRLLAWGPGTGMGYEEPPRGKASRFGWAEVEVREGETAAVEVKMAPGVTLEASTVGAGCEGMDSLTLRTEGEWFRHWAFEPVKVAGGWRWERLPAGHYRAEMPALEAGCVFPGVRTKGQATAARVVRLAESGRVEVVVECGNGVVEGRVRGGEADGRRVVLFSEDERGFAAEAVCGDDGGFRFEGLSAGKYAAIAYTKTGRGERKGVVVERGQRVAIELKAGGE